MAHAGTQITVPRLFTPWLSHCSLTALSWLMVKVDDLKTEIYVCDYVCLKVLERCFLIMLT